jgi:hypothetical protein
MSWATPVPAPESVRALVVSAPLVSEPIVAAFEKRLVLLAVVAKKAVDVAAVAESDPSVVRPVTPSVPLNDPLPAVRVPIVAALLKRLVDDAVVEKSVVEVAFVSVAVFAVSEPMLDVPIVSVLEKSAELDAVVAKSAVEVANVICPKMAASLVVEALSAVKLVDEAVVAKNDVEVPAVALKLPRVVRPLNVLAPVKVLMSPRSVEDAARPVLMQTPFTAKHPAVRLIPCEPVDVAVKLMRAKLALPRVEVALPEIVRALVMPSDVVVALLKKAVVELARVAKKFVVVAFDAVSVPSVLAPVTPSVPLNDPLPAVRDPIVAALEKRFVDDAVVAKNVVLVELPSVVF